MNAIPVSVIIPSYNRLVNVTGAIESVLSQAYPPDCCEIVVVDDGSTDGAIDALRQKYGDRIRCLSQKNQGAAAARNTGIEHASHDVIAFLDSEDAWLSKKLATQAPLMNASDVVLSYTNWAYMDIDPSNDNGFIRAGFSPGASRLLFMDRFEVRPRPHFY